MVLSSRMAEDLAIGLEMLGLDEYVPSCKEAGFQSWSSLDTITEEGLAALNMRLGDRRKLQREIARRHHWPDSMPLPSTEQLEQHVSSRTSRPYRSHQPRFCNTPSFEPEKTPAPSRFSKPDIASWTLSLQELEREKRTPVPGGEPLWTLSAPPATSRKRARA